MSATTRMRSGSAMAALAAPVLVGALLAAAAAWLIGEWVLTQRERPRSEATSHGMVTEDMARRNLQAAIAFDQRLAGVMYGGLGAALGLGLGLAGGLSRRSLGAALGAGVLGLVTAGAIAAAVAVVITPTYHLHRDPDSNGIVFPLLIHGPIWCSLGLAAGLALGVGRGGSGRLVLESALAGLFGAAIGTALFEVLGMIAFPLDHTTDLVASSWAARLTAILFVTLGCALSVILTARTTPEASEPGPPSPA